MLTDKLMRAKEVNASGELWKMLLTETNLAEDIKNNYTVATGSIMQDEDDEATPEVTEDEA